MRASHPIPSRAHSQTPSVGGAVIATDAHPLHALSKQRDFSEVVATNNISCCLDMLSRVLLTPM